MLAFPAQHVLLHNVLHWPLFKCLEIERCVGFDPLPQTACYALMHNISLVNEHLLRASPEGGRIKAAEPRDSDKICAAERNLLWFHVPWFKLEVSDYSHPCWRLIDRPCRRLSPDPDASSETNFHGPHLHGL